jgi:hypothetical protein
MGYARAQINESHQEAQVRHLMLLDKEPMVG